MSYRDLEMSGRVGCDHGGCAITARVEWLERFVMRRFEIAERAARPRVWMRGRVVYTPEARLDLSRRKLPWRLYHAFLSMDGHVAGVPDLLRMVYDIDVRKGDSRRVCDATRDSLLKLVSRVRREAESAFGEKHPGWLWFPYDHKISAWRLYTIQADHEDLDDNKPRGQPPMTDAISKTGRYIAMTTKPTMPPMTTIRTGSMRERTPLMAMSTSSS